MTEDCKECGWNNNGNCLAYPDMCAEIDDCEHKQLKRLEQENKELKDNDCEKCKHLDLYMKYKSALEEIEHGIMHIPPFDKQSAQMIEAILKLINEVLNPS